jgi:4-amino-4-deoxy-L-arabinose transferase-like glycosyltransferase
MAVTTLRQPGRPLAVLLGDLSLWPIAIWAVLVASALAARPPLAPDESRILSIAWRMWADGAWLPFKFGDQSRSLPPLLFWLIEAGWAVFGVSQIWARLVDPLFALATLLVTQRLARLLWPTRPEVAPLSGIVLVGSGGFAVYSGLTLLELPLLFFFTLALLGLAQVWRNRAGLGWTVYALAVGLGILSAGLVAAMLLPLPLLAPLWMPRAPGKAWYRWYRSLAAALTGGVLLALPWLAPVFWATPEIGGPPVVHSAFTLSDETRPWYWGIAMAPLMLYPWLWWRTLWRATALQWRQLGEPALRFCLVAVTIGLVALVLGSRNADSLLCALPPLALAAARLLASQGGKPQDFHAALPGFIALLVGLIAFLLNIVPVAHLDVVWREFIDPHSSLPIWLGGISLLSGLTLLGGGFILAQLTPRQLQPRCIQLALLPVLLMTTLNLEFLYSLGRFFDLRPVAEQLRALERDGRPFAFYGAYRGDFDFVGRLQKPLPVLDDRVDTIAWLAANPTGIVIAYFKGSLLHLPARPMFLGLVGDSWAAMWPAATVLATDEAVLAPYF